MHCYGQPWQDKLPGEYIPFMIMQHQFLQLMQSAVSVAVFSSLAHTYDMLPSLLDNDQEWSVSWPHPYNAICTHSSTGGSQCLESTAS